MDGGETVDNGQQGWPNPAECHCWRKNPFSSNLGEKTWIFSASTALWLKKYIVAAGAHARKCLEPRGEREEQKGGLARRAAVASQIRSAMLHSFIHGLIKVFVWPMCCVLIFPFFTQEVDRYLRHHDFLNLRKKEILYKKWLEDVSEPLLWKIEDKMDSQSREEIQKRREEQLSLYLNYCKKKVSRCKFLPWKGLWARLGSWLLLAISWPAWCSIVPYF